MTERDARAGSAPAPPHAIPRIATGNRDLDLVLGGGFLEGSLNVIMGSPGTGKTLLAEQLAFANAGPDCGVLLLTTLSEPLGKMVRHVQGLSFFDPAKVGTSVQLRDLGDVLFDHGYASMLPELEKILTPSDAPRIVVIDSFKAVQDLTNSIPERRRLVFDLANLLTASGVTSFLIGEYEKSDAVRRPEFAVADSIVELSRQTRGARDERFLRVLKLRGGGYLEGSHAFSISRHGIELFPRFVSPTVSDAYQNLRERLPTGVAGLDPLVGGGLLTGSATLVAGNAGAGKTTFGLQFVAEAARRGEPSVYLSLEEPEEVLTERLARLGLGEGVPGPLTILYNSPVELQIDRIVGQLLQTLEREGARRVAIDALGDLATASSGELRIHDFLYALAHRLRRAGVTSVLLFETVSGLSGGAIHDTRLSHLVDNIVELRNEDSEPFVRTLRVVKSRDTEHSLLKHVITIDRQGMHLTSGMHDA